MRYPTALILLATLACTDPALSVSETPTFDPDLFPNSLSCSARAIDFDPPGRVERVVAASDSSILIVYADARELVVVDAELTELRRLALEPEGPSGVAALHDATLLDDSLFVVADGPLRRLRAFTPGGELAWSVQLPIMPDRVLATPAGIAVFPLVLAGLPASGAYLVRDGVAQDLGVDVVEIADAQMGTLANLVAPAVPLGSRTLVVPHQFIAPVASLIDLTGRASPRRIPMPIAESTAPQAWWVPGPPYSEADMERIIAPALSATAGPGRGEITILTRTGAKRGAFTEKAVVRLDERLGVVDAWTIPVNAVHLAWLASDEAFTIMTSDEAWYRCGLPSTSAEADHP